MRFIVSDADRRLLHYANVVAFVYFEYTSAVCVVLCLYFCGSCEYLLEMNGLMLNKLEV